MAEEFDGFIYLYLLLQFNLKFDRGQYPLETPKKKSLSGTKEQV